MFSENTVPPGVSCKPLGEKVMVELASLTPPAFSLMNYFTADVATRAVGSIFCVKWWGFPLLFPLADWFLWGVLLMKFSLLLHGLPNLQ